MVLAPNRSMLLFIFLSIFTFAAGAPQVIRSSTTTSSALQFPSGTVFSNLTIDDRDSALVYNGSWLQQPVAQGLAFQNTVSSATSGQVSVTFFNATDVFIQCLLNNNPATQSTITLSLDSASLSTFITPPPSPSTVQVVTCAALHDIDPLKQHNLVLDVLPSSNNAKFFLDSVIFRMPSQSPLGMPGDLNLTNIPMTIPNTTVSQSAKSTSPTSVSSSTPSTSLSSTVNSQFASSSSVSASSSSPTPSNPPAVLDRAAVTFSLVIGCLLVVALTIGLYIWCIRGGYLRRYRSKGEKRALEKWRADSVTMVDDSSLGVAKIIQPFPFTESESRSSGKGVESGEMERGNFVVVNGSDSDIESGERDSAKSESVRARAGTDASVSSKAATSSGKGSVLDINMPDFESNPVPDPAVTPSIPSKSRVIPLTPRPPPSIRGPRGIMRPVSRDLPPIPTGPLPPLPNIDTSIYSSRKSSFATSSFSQHLPPLSAILESESQSRNTTPDPNPNHVPGPSVAARPTAIVIGNVVSPLSPSRSLSPSSRSLIANQVPPRLPPPMQKLPPIPDLRSEEEGEGKSDQGICDDEQKSRGGVEGRSGVGRTSELVDDDFEMVTPIMEKSGSSFHPYIRDIPTTSSAEAARTEAEIPLMLPQNRDALIDPPPLSPTLPLSPRTPRSPISPRGPRPPRAPRSFRIVAEQSPPPPSPRTPHTTSVEELFNMFSPMTPSEYALRSPRTPTSPPPTRPTTSAFTFPNVRPSETSSRPRPDSEAYTEARARGYYSGTSFFDDPMHSRLPELSFESGSGPRDNGVEASESPALPEGVSPLGRTGFDTRMKRSEEVDLMGRDGSGIRPILNSKV
ncbi:hypothetical protein SISSUDRAFT_1130619 [Sistotremastrum suecicum HHB10207 ss-3]|uniref:Mid2 domain-containing protein n=1 Tax=Sistotremastrum suecicum HHB10207 ss-3 TaxID=1314776 RepID=A0A166B7S2_9AGAM|nr:hypothetical protein SISSUDRAFT_1130619 [Sistotremastrum suecicum HHB10207 ss-3]